MSVRAAAYARTSTDRQDQSIEDQLAAISKYAHENGYKIVRQYVEDDKSGTDAENRPVFMEMYDLVTSDKADFDAVLVYDHTRWGRFGTFESIGREWMCTIHNAQVIYTNGPNTQGNSMDGVLISTVLRFMAQEYSRNLSKLCTRGLQSSAKKGRWLSRRPYGYNRVEIGEDGNQIRVLGKRERKNHKDHHIILVPGDKDEVETIRKIFSLTLEGFGANKVAAILNEAGIPSPAGRLWIQASVRHILAREVNFGKMVYGKAKLGKFSREDNLWGDKGPKKYLHDKENWIVVENAYVPIIDEETFYKAKEARLHRTLGADLTRNRGLGSTFLLSGLLFCAKCGAKYSGHNHYVNHGRKTTTSYRCTTTKTNGRAMCDSLMINRARVDRFVLGYVQNLLNNPDFYKMVESKIRAMLEETQPLRRDDNVIEKKIHRAENAIARLMNIMESSDGSNWEEYDKRITEHKKVIQQLKMELAQSGSKPKPQKSIEEKIEDIRRRFSDAANYLTDSVPGDTENNAKKKNILAQFLYKAIVAPDATTVTFYFYKVPPIDADQHQTADIAPMAAVSSLSTSNHKSAKKRMSELNTEDYHVETIILKPDVVEEDGKKWYRMRPFAELRKVQPSTVRNWANTGKYPTKKIYGKKYICEKPEDKEGSQTVAEKTSHGMPTAISQKIHQT